MSIQRIKNISKFLLVMVVVGCSLSNAAESPDDIGKNPGSPLNVSRRGSQAKVNFPGNGLGAEHLTTANRIMKQELQDVRDKTSATLTLIELSKDLENTDKKEIKIQELTQKLHTEVEALLGDYQKSSEVLRDVCTVLFEIILVRNKVEEEEHGLVIEELKKAPTVDLARIVLDDEKKLQQKLQEQSDKLKELYEFLNSSGIKIAKSRLVRCSFSSTFTPEFKLGVLIDSMIDELNNQKEKETQMDTEKQEQIRLINEMKAGLNYQRSVIGYCKTGFCVLSAIIILLLCDKYGKIQLSEMNFSSVS